MNSEIIQSVSYDNYDDFQPPSKDEDIAQRTRIYIFHLPANPLSWPYLHGCTYLSPTD
jgi:hypothetical protein